MCGTNSPSVILKQTCLFRMAVGYYRFTDVNLWQRKIQVV